MKEPAILATLRKAAEGLLFISESEAELTPFCWGADTAVDEEGILANPERDYEPDTAVEATTLERFFRAVPPEDKAKFDRLAGVLKRHLSDLCVYKVGEVEKDVYLVGKTTDGRWAGLRTTVVET